MPVNAVNVPIRHHGTTPPVERHVPSSRMTTSTASVQESKVGRVDDGIVYICLSLHLRISFSRLLRMINKMLYSSIASLALSIGAAAQATYHNSSSGSRLRVDNGTYGPEIEEVHYCELPLP